ncbi:hypothetical protein [Caballeronia sp. TF1N1]|uniref:hypothetical protein n=1 Tax=Caballeronia sp. TF1N1 TaxID=2878153 RepID=UPI001FD25CA1|nr:hypothetical protein [Caballeronia sp. TF1N1]
MSFPEWGYSYNALYVPLGVNWFCALVPTREVHEVDRNWNLPFEERKKKRQEQQEHIAQDRQDFDRLFRLHLNQRGARISSEFREYVDFISRNLRVSNWDLLDGDGVTRVLRLAVRDGHIVPAISRCWHGGRRVFKQYAPQRWPSTGGGDRGSHGDDVEVMSYGAFKALQRANGELGGRVPLLETDGLGTTRRLTSGLSGTISGSEDNGLGWPSVIAAAGGELLGGSDGTDHADSMLDNFDGNGASVDDSLLDNAEPFEYQPELPDGDVFDVAKTPNDGEPGTWYTNPGSGQMRLYGDSRNAAVDFDFDHDHGQGIPHAHNWSIDPLTGKNVRGPGVPFSILP